MTYIQSFALHRYNFQYLALHLSPTQQMLDMPTPIGVGRGGEGLGPLPFLCEGPNMTVAPSFSNNAAPSLS